MRTALIAIVVMSGTALAQATPAPKRTLRVCADPNNLPFSNDRGEGFENKLAELLAKELQADVAYTWWAQRRGFIRNTLKAKSCDVVLGIPAELDAVATTRPYYRSTYVFVSGAKGPRIDSLDDARLKTLRIGVPLVGDDGANPPPVHALARRGIVDNVRGYSVLGDYRQDSPPSELIHAVERGEVDVAIAWGPLAGYYAKRARPHLVVTPVKQRFAGPQIPLTFEIAVGVRHADKALRAELDAALTRRHAEIAALLDVYGVPRL